MEGIWFLTLKCLRYQPSGVTQHVGYSKTLPLGRSSNNAPIESNVSSLICAYHDTDRPNIHFRIPIHSQNHLRGAVNSRHNVASVLLGTSSSLTKITEDWLACTERHRSRVVNSAITKNLPGDGSCQFILLNLGKDWVILDPLKNVIWWNIWQRISF